MATEKLTGELILRRVFDPTTQALLTTPAATSEMAIEIDAADGDNILIKPDNALIEDLNEYSCIGMKGVELYVEPNVSPLSAKIEVSPVDVGDVWMEVASSTVAADASVVKSSGTKTICARRIRVTNVSGTPVVYLVMQAV